MNSNLTTRNMNEILIRSCKYSFSKNNSMSQIKLHNLGKPLMFHAILWYLWMKLKVSIGLLGETIVKAWKVGHVLKTILHFLTNFLPFNCWVDLCKKKYFYTTLINVVPCCLIISCTDNLLRIPRLYGQIRITYLRTDQDNTNIMLIEWSCTDRDEAGIKCV